MFTTSYGGAGHEQIRPAYSCRYFCKELVTQTSIRERQIFLKRFDVLTFLTALLPATRRKRDIPRALEKPKSAVRIQSGSDLSEHLRAATLPRLSRKVF